MSDLVVCENAAQCADYGCPHRWEHERTARCEPPCGRGLDEEDADDGWECIPVEGEE